MKYSYWAYFQFSGYTAFLSELVDADVMANKCKFEYVIII